MSLVADQIVKSQFVAD